MSWFGGSPRTPQPEGAAPPAAETLPDQVVELPAVVDEPPVVETLPEPEKLPTGADEPPVVEKLLEEPVLPEEEGEPPAKKPKLALGSVVPDPENETRDEFLERARKKFKFSRAKIVDKAKGVEGLWELWPIDEEPPLVVATPKVKGKAKAEPKTKVVPKAKAEAEPRRGRPGSNTDLKDRLLDGGEINDGEEYERVPALVKLANQQHMRLVKAGKFDDAQAAFQETQKLFEAADRWADANGTARLRRVEQKHRQHDVLFRTGLQMITAAHRGDSELLANELRRNRRAEEI